MALPLFLPCAAGVEPLLADEVTRILPGRTVHVGRGGVGVDGDPADVMALNLESRLAQRVLAEVASGPYFHEDDIYALARSVDWTQWITPQHTLRVDTTAHRSPLRSLNFVALRVKDAVCDVLRDATGERPSVDTRHPDLPLSLHLGETHASVYVDTSGEALFKRGWREDKGEAPLKETLAAAMLAAAGWQGTPEAGGALHDPCCGSGTIAIEAAQIACGVAPGLKRRFAFERLLPFADPDSRAQWQRLKSYAQSRIHASAVPIFASDVSFRMVDFARRNAQRAGVEHAIQFNGGDALERPAPQLPEDLAGTLMVNPPYGERIDVSGKAARPSMQERPDDNRAAPDDFFPRLSAHWKRAYTQHPAGWTAWVLSPDMKLPSAMRLKESRRVPMWNGPIECRLFRFELVAGSARAQ
ncbi:class I SAM-dependent RNA methyltransferase [Piscinibacter sp. HJYY11]|uniref:THUMP domain-containing class I SAM-dependent RNA methyltransferase n=1 Tax=Piscinibacter sp. HJYY11 TaxID=2801333 RepID=UPI00191F4958|nr:THUMP domain-containing protein [Piscinibacter sp. HJYY11]MBL0728787.1 class I SAM-dependent RNA methyltransferase [Piscinibacter sp. HJYY11]